MSFLKNVIDSLSVLSGSVANILETATDKSRHNEEKFSDITNDASHIKHLTQQFIDNELVVDKNKDGWQVFSQHQELLTDCLKRYEDVRLGELEVSQREQAKRMLEALQQDREPEAGDDIFIDKDTYINGLKKITLSYCQKSVLGMVDFLDDIPEHLCDGKNVSTSKQSFRNDTSKKRWKNFDQACRDKSLYFSTGKLFFDTTLWGSGKQGIMLGRDDITCLGGEPDKFRVLWRNVTSFWCYKGYLYVNDYKTGFVANNDACELLELLEEHYKKVQRSDGNILLTYLGYGVTEQQAIKNAYETDVQQFVE